jgi:phage I-like protein
VTGKDRMTKTIIDPKWRRHATETEAAYLDAVLEYGGKRAAARALGMAKSTIDGAMARLEARAALAASSPNVPMSEDVEKFHADWTPEMCIAELRRIAQIDTTKVISRNYFRNESRISE